MAFGGGSPQRAGPIVFEEVELKPTQWKPSRQELMIMATLSGLSLMVSFDASVIVTSLSVRRPLVTVTGLV